MAFYKKPWTDPLTREDIKFSLTDSLNGIDSGIAGRDFAENIHVLTSAKKSFVVFPYPKKGYSDQLGIRNFPVRHRGQKVESDLDQVSFQLTAEMHNMIARVQELEQALDDPSNVWKRLREAWLFAEDSKKPKISEIVRQASKITPHIKDLEKKIRRILRRDREKIQLDRVQEMDRASMRWLSRQPGKTLAQRAGSDQRILAIVRKENFDTLENRVLHAYVLLAERVAQVWMDEHPKASATKRYELVDKFRKFSRNFARQLKGMGVGKAEANTTPNYVLMQDRNYKEVYDITHPLQQIEQPRPLRRSPFYSRLGDQKAKFFEVMGWERPQWYESNKDLLQGKNFPNRTGWSAKYWSPIQAVEHMTTRQTGALFDITGFVKIEVSGKGALALLQKVCTNNIDVKVGKVVYTVISNIYGGIKSDLTVSRLEEDKFWILAGAGNGMIDLSWFKENAPKDGSVNIIDWTSAYAGVGLWGPNSRKVLESLCEDDDVSNEGFPFFSIKNLSISHLPCIAVRISYIGELGWEIYTPTEYGLTLWDEIKEKSQEFNMICSGAGAFESLRLEKGYRSLGSDIHTNSNPYEAGLGFTVKLKKQQNFIGKEALTKLKQEPLKKKLCCMVMEDSEGMALGKEPIYDKNSKPIGYVTSTNYGYFVDKHILYGYLPSSHSTEGTKLEIDYFGKRYPVMVTKEPLLDPENIRLKS